MLNTNAKFASKIFVQEKRHKNPRRLGIRKVKINKCHTKQMCNNHSGQQFINIFIDLQLQTYNINSPTSYAISAIQGYSFSVAFVPDVILVSVAIGPQISFGNNLQLGCEVITGDDRSLYNTTVGVGMAVEGATVDALVDVCCIDKSQHTYGVLPSKAHSFSRISLITELGRGITVRFNRS